MFGIDESSELLWDMQLFSQMVGSIAQPDIEKDNWWTNMGKLTTHVLDTGSGNPAAGLKIEIYRLSGGRQKLAEVVTNDDGRVDNPILEGESFELGEYELVFHAGAYLESTDQDLPDPKFLNVIPLRFGMAEDKHYHVPLLLSAFGYSTYRGS